MSSIYFIKLAGMITTTLQLLSLVVGSNAYASLVFYDNAAGSPLVTMIGKAKNSIDIEIYEMDDLKVQTEIKAALNRGVKVRIIQEPTPVGGCRPFDSVDLSGDANCSNVRELISAVRNAGGVYVPFDKQLCGLGPKCFQHGKLLIVDRSVALISTGNFNASSLCDQSQDPAKCNRDYTLVDDDSQAVSSFLTIFENDLSSQPSDLQSILTSHSVQNRITVSPTQSLSPILNLIHSAKKSLVIENQYLKESNMNQAIIDAAHRGVDVSVIVSSICAFAHNAQELKQQDPNGVKLWTQTYTSFENAGIKVRAFPSKMTINGKPGYLHAKAILVDQRLAWIGSVNGSTDALTNNREFGELTSDTKVTHALYDQMMRDLSHPYIESWQESLQCKNDTLN